MTKKIGILFCVLFLTGEVKSQNKYGEDSVNCVINLSLYREYYKQKNYDDAINPWRWVYNNCPSSSGNIFKNGPTLIKYLMKKNPENKPCPYFRSNHFFRRNTCFGMFRFLF